MHADCLSAQPNGLSELGQSASSGFYESKARVAAWRSEGAREQCFTIAALPPSVGGHHRIVISAASNRTQDVGALG